MASRRALLLAAAAAPLLAGCGFQLRQAPTFAFKSIHLGTAPGSQLGQELRRQLQGTGQVEVITDAARAKDADVVLESLRDQRERVVVGMNAAGQVREVQLRVRFRFRLRTPGGREILPADEIVRQIDQSYSESAALSKEAEAQMLYQNMQSDIVQQVIRRLATVKP